LLVITEHLGQWAERPPAVEIPVLPISARISCNVLKLSGILHGLTMSLSPTGDPYHAVAPHGC
jgi:hypothetical protein